MKIRNKPQVLGLALAASLVTMLAGCASQAHHPATEKTTSAQGAQKAAQLLRQEVAQGLYEIVHSQKQNAVFVASAGGRGEKPKVLRLNPETLAVQAEIALDLGGFGLALDDANNRLYIGHAKDGRISVVDTATNTLVTVIHLADKVIREDGREAAPYGLRELVLDKANGRLYAPGHGYPYTSVLYVIDTKTNRLEKTIPDVGYIATGIALDAQGKRLFISALDSQIYVVDTEKLEVTQSYDSGADQPLNLAYDPQLNRLFATDQGAEYFQKQRKTLQPDYIVRPGNRVIVIDASTGKELASLPTQKTPVALQIDSARQRLYVTSRDGGTLDVFDIGTYQRQDSVPLPTHPNSLAIDQASGAVFVTVKNGSGNIKGSRENVARIAY